MESKAKWIFSGVEAAIFGRLNPNTGTLDEIGMISRLTTDVPLDIFHST